MHLAGVPTAVASCGTAFGAEHVSVIRRLLGDDSFDHGEVIYTFDGDAAGQAAARKAFDGDQSFAAQTFVCVAPDGQDPCDLRLSAGDTVVRDLVARREPLFEFAIRAELREHDLDTAEGRVAALQRCVPIVARIKREELRDEYARRLAGLDGLGDEFARSSAGCARRPGSRLSAPALPVPPRRRRPATTRACTGSARRSRRRCRFPRSPGRATTSFPSRRSRTRRTSSCTGLCRPPAGCAVGGRVRHGWTPSSPSARRSSAAWSASWPSRPLELPLKNPTRRATSPASSPACAWPWSTRRSRRSSRGCSARTRWTTPTRTWSCSAISCRWSSTGSRCARRRWERST